MPVKEYSDVVKMNKKNLTHSFELKSASAPLFCLCSLTRESKSPETAIETDRRYTDTENIKREARAMAMDISGVLI